MRFITHSLAWALGALLEATLTFSSGSDASFSAQLLRLAEPLVHGSVYVMAEP
jgi:hypothetical protein